MSYLRNLIGFSNSTADGSPIKASPNAHFLQVDPFPLLQTGNAGFSGSIGATVTQGDALPRIEVTSPRRSPSRGSADSLRFGGRRVNSPYAVSDDPMDS